MILGYLKDHLHEDDYTRLADKHFQDQVRKVKGRLLASGAQGMDSNSVEKLFHRVQYVRVLRNQLAHSCLVLRMNPDSKEVTLGMILPKDLYDENLGAEKHLTARDLQEANEALKSCIEALKALCPGWSGWAGIDYQ